LAVNTDKECIQGGAGGLQPPYSHGSHGAPQRFSTINEGEEEEKEEEEEGKERREEEERKMSLS